MLNNVEEYRAYVVHMISEHRRLHEAVRTIEQRWHVLDMDASEGTMTDLITSLKQLRDELCQHFTEEESGGCIEEAVTRCPSLSDKAARIEHEHESLLEQLDRIIQQLREIRVDVGYPDTAHDFQRFVEHLLDHESAENVILQQGFGIE